MNKKKYGRRLLNLILASLIIFMAVTGCGTSDVGNNSDGSGYGVTQVSTGESSASGDITIGIAWRADPDSEFYTNIAATLDDIGARYVMLNQVVTGDIPYESGNVAAECIDDNDVLKQEYADVIKSNTYNNSNAEKVMDGINAVIFTGGEDIAPTLLKEPASWHGIQEEKDYNATRDVNDYILMSYCLDKDIPIMGFCRGMQMLGTVSGATFIQDIPEYFRAAGIEYNYLHRNNKISPDAYRDYAPHDVNITDRDSVLYQIVGSDVLKSVPSWHHQALLSVDGTKLKVTGTTDTNGISMIESIQRTDKKFAVGFQFHPEAAVVKNLNNADNAGKFMDRQTAENFFIMLIKAAR